MPPATPATAGYAAGASAFAASSAGDSDSSTISKSVIAVIVGISLLLIVSVIICLWGCRRSSRRNAERKRTVQSQRDWIGLDPTEIAPDSVWDGSRWTMLSSARHKEGSVGVEEEMNIIRWPKPTESSWPRTEEEEFERTGSFADSPSPPPPAYTGRE